VITVAMSTVIGAEPGRVWRALVEPSELAAWEERIVAPAGPSAPGPLRPGRRLRWRCRLAGRGTGVQMLRADEALEVVPERRLRTRMVLGTLALERTFSLAPELGDTPRTRLSVTLRAANSVPVFGAVIDRFRMRELATELGDETLRALQKWCESRPQAR
jgi:uncharacterized protein YndB with AHSA1/START domain